MKLPLTGSCQCGKIRYEITQSPQLVYTCHCTDCQRITSSAFSLGIALPETAFRLTAGEPRPLQRMADSGRLNTRFFAPIVHAGSRACRAMASSASGPERSTTHHGCGQPGIFGRAASSPGSPSPKGTRPSSGNLPVRSVAAGLRIGGEGDADFLVG